jgi:hypothetical protein
VASALFSGPQRRTRLPAHTARDLRRFLLSTHLPPPGPILQRGGARRVRGVDVGDFLVGARGGMDGVPRTIPPIRTVPPPGDELSAKSRRALHLRPLPLHNSLHKATHALYSADLACVRGAAGRSSSSLRARWVIKLRSHPASWPAGGRQRVKRLLIRAGYALAPVVMFGTIALVAGPGRHRVAILALAAVVSVMLGMSAGGVGAKSVEPERPAPPPAQTEQDRTAVPQEPLTHTPVL